MPPWRGTLRSRTRSALGVYSSARGVTRKRDRWRVVASVPILKFLFNFCVDRECAAAEAFDGGQDIVGCLGPAERFGVGVAGLDIGIDRRFQVGGRAMGATLDLLLGQQREEPLDLVDP